MLRGCRLLLVVLACLLGTQASATGPLPPGAPASHGGTLLLEAQGLEAGRICQVVRTCNFRRTAKVRGCLSSYTCRQCSFRKRCSDGRCEWQSVCTWGGG
jgi:hypothetical protein